MKTFAELLTDYMARTGTSDSELARTLGVRRQTIFRWKEGLVERPRHREDVLLCAKKLRLTPEERDELLLAAGFAPENPETVLPAPVQPPAPIPIVESQAMVAPQADSLVESPPNVLPQPTTIEIAPLHTPRRAKRPKIARVAVAVVILLLIVGLVAIFSFRPDANYPTALPGEQLVVIAQFETSQPKATPDAPSRKLPGENAGATTDDFASRLQVAVEREVRAARIDNVRVITWSVQLRDTNAAESFRQRANASIVIWGNASNDKVAVAFDVAPLASRADDMPLDALIVAPQNISLVVSEASPDEIQSLALVAVSELYLIDGDSILARASLTQALARPPVDQSSLAMLNLRLGYAMQISKPPELGDAIQFYSQTIALAPDHPTAYLNQGVAYIRLNDAAGWQADFARVLALQPDHIGAQLAQCWAYALDQKPDLALPHCDAAVSRDSSPRSREARAIVYAELGRLSDATADLQMFVDWLANQPASLRARYGTSRADWLQSLQAGQNPIDATILGKLRQE